MIIINLFHAVKQKHDMQHIWTLAETVSIENFESNEVSDKVVRFIHILRLLNKWKYILWIFELKYYIVLRDLFLFVLIYSMRAIIKTWLKTK